MSEKFDVTPEYLQEISGKFTTIKSKIEVELKKVVDEMGSLNNEWQSQSATEFNNNIKKLQKAIQPYYKVIENYALFLKQAGERYGEADQDIEKTVKTKFDLFS